MQWFFLWKVSWKSRSVTVPTHLKRETSFFVTSVWFELPDCYFKFSSWPCDVIVRRYTAGNPSSQKTKQIFYQPIRFRAKAQPSRVFERFACLSPPRYLYFQLWLAYFTLTVDAIAGLVIKCIIPHMVSLMSWPYLPDACR